MSDYSPGVGLIICNNTFDYHSSGSGEGTALVIVPVGMKRINIIQVPHPAVCGILGGIHSVELNKNCNRVSGHVPPSYSDINAFGKQCIFDPAPHKCLRFDKIRRRIVVTPYVRTNKYQFVLETRLQSLGFAGKHGIDASYFIANLPARFEEHFDFLTAIVHIP